MVEKEEQKYDATNEFLASLQAKTITFDKIDNPNPKAQMYTLSESMDEGMIPRGGVILKADDTIGSKYYSHSDLMTAIEEFAKKISENQEVSETRDESSGNTHKVTKTRKVDVKAFADVISKATKIYLDKNEEITTQDARIVSKDMENGKEKVKKAGGIMAGKAGTELKNEAYIDSEAIKVAVREFIETKIVPIVPPPVVPITPTIPTNNIPVENVPEDKEKEEEKKHVVTANKGKVKNGLKKALIATLVTIALMTSLKSCEANKTYVGQDPQIDYVQIEDTKEQIEKQVNVEVNEAFKNGMGQEYTLTGKETYLRDPKIAEDAKGQNAVKVSDENPYAKPGDKVKINGLSINAEDGKTVAYDYDKNGDENRTVEDFVRESSPDEDGSYKVYAHVKSETTDLGWIRIGGADVKMQESQTQKVYYIISTQEGEIMGIVESDGEPKNIDDLKPIEQAPKDIQEEANQKIQAQETNGDMEI